MLDAIGGFDPAFGAGYGEENDLCMRAAAAGWRNVLADDALVLHTGGRSFEKQKDALVPKNTEVLLARHPGYLLLVHDYVAADPLAPLRDAATLALDAEGAGGVLHVLHHQGGERRRTCARWSRPRAGDGATRSPSRWATAGASRRTDPTAGPSCSTSTACPTSPGAISLGGLCATLGVRLVHVHNVSACRDGLLTALAALDLPFGYTVHDVNAGCPTITFLGPDGMYCGAQTDPAACGACLAAQPAFAGVDIVAWREAHRPLVERASFLIAPSRWAADTLARYYPSARVRVVPHGIPEATTRHAGTRLAVMLPDDGVPTVAALARSDPTRARGASSAAARARARARL